MLTNWHVHSQEKRREVPAASADPLVAAGGSDGAVYHVGQVTGSTERRALERRSVASCQQGAQHFHNGVGECCAG